MTKCQVHSHGNTRTKVPFTRAKRSVKMGLHKKGHHENRTNHPLLLLPSLMAYRLARGSHFPHDHRSRGARRFHPQFAVVRPRDRGDLSRRGVVFLLYAGMVLARATHAGEGIVNYKDKALRVACRAFRVMKMGGKFCSHDLEILEHLCALALPMKYRFTQQELNEMKAVAESTGRPQ